MKCHNAKKREDFLNTTIEAFTRRSSYGRHAYQSIRTAARIQIKQSGAEMKCAVCGYSAHVEVSHKKPIGDFAKDTTLRDVNAPDNLVLLCPNHHWEFDNGLLNL